MRALSQLEYFEELGKELGVSPERAQDIWEKTLNFWIKEVGTYGSLAVPYFANIKMAKRGGRYFHIPNWDKSEGAPPLITKYQEEYYSPYVQVKDCFQDAVCGRTSSRTDIRQARDEIKKQELMISELEKQKQAKERQQQALDKIKKRKEEKKQREAQRKIDEKLKKKGLYRAKDSSDFGNMEEE